MRFLLLLPSTITMDRNTAKTRSKTWVGGKIASYLLSVARKAMISAAILQHKAERLCDEEHLVLTRCPLVFLTTEGSSESEKNHIWNTRKHWLNKERKRSSADFLKHEKGGFYFQLQGFIP